MHLVVDNSNYDNFLNTRFVSGSFLQSSIWRDFLKAQGKNIWQLAVIDSNETIAVCLLYENKLPWGRSYLYAPKGPILSDGLSLEKKKEALDLILSKARDVSIDTTTREEIFFKLEPAEMMDLPQALIKSDDVQPRNTWLLDISKDHKELLANMHTKTRYNISLAKRKGVKIRFSDNDKDLEHFLKLIAKTASRNQIAVHNNKYYRLFWQIVKKHGAGKLAIAQLDDKVIAVNILLNFAKSRTYVHGASDYSYRAYMAPHLLQWESIKEAQDKGYKMYDFWGIAPEDGSKPKWQGFSRFKKSFGGMSLESPGAYNLVYNNSWYRAYRVFKKVRTILKR